MKIELSGIAVILTIVFVVLKLTEVIAWSWWWVFSPLLIGVGLWIIGIILALLIAVVAVIIESRR